ncbi:M56 family metallopeptidase [Novosphingobium album (ex Hu et al. 2023)]|uniref:M56 family metallopeptidase n=1 Tax=Novosphingobium album (ex Hu et al. 2023) TaxID=2930093 RepID=A0ABT0AWA4_9SPHN|nr:M56 family metallopeptidase [Novosphingobium album (ex Hu et al. 2023)]MCJ2177113.1 M56 family metallopeptidase [Novosphingobium album (ex Hu et al. 2023)]
MIEWLTDTLVMTGALMALVLLVRRPVGRWFGPSAAYALWALPMLRLVLPPLALPRGLVPHFEVGVQQITASAHIPAEVIAPVVRTGPADVPATDVMSAAADPGFLAQVPWAQLLLAFWLAGAAAFLAWRCWNYVTMRRELLAGARQVATAGGVRIIESPVAAAPLAFGVFDKVVALPSGFLADTDSENSDFAIAHELEHHAGNDLLAIIVMQPLFALHWFNPLAWAAWRALRGDQEAACDARVMAGRDRAVRARYGRLIASYAAGTRLALAAPMAGPLRGGKPIIHRLKALACSDISPARRVLGRSLFAMAVVAVPATATVSYAAMDDADATDTGAVQAAPAVPAVPAVPALTPVAAHRTVAAVPHVHGGPAPLTCDEEAAVAPVPPAPVAPPEPPAPPAIERNVWISKAREQEAERRAAEAGRRAAEAGRRAAEAERMAADAAARAPQVEESVTRDGKKVIRITRKDESGKPRITQQMILDEDCSADQRREKRTEAKDGTTSVVICTGVPRVAMTATVSALKSARQAIVSNRNLDEQTRAEALGDLDRETADAFREMKQGR